MAVYYWPTIHNKFFANSLGDLQTFSEAMLVPLESSQSLTSDDAEEALTKLAAEVESQPSSPAYPRARRALQLLEQASRERNLCLEKAHSETSHNALDEVPGEWHVAGHPEQHIDVTQINHEVSASFWVQVTLKQWRDRCGQYRTALAPLFDPDRN